ncbi:DMT family transporter [Poseidonibacter lekithochrous]|uniref:DMT family transporter n=1 Tax=Poseidonibacter lekithochrous TaxID=1904463 RepID=UPI0008FC9AA1|nr:DMT family transporter [Poseidonibacter lekithochrous]QKJ24230.1 EamA/RhaT family transporter [Poseidonibacter lekithochrous]
MLLSMKTLALPIVFIFLYGSGFVFTAFGLENSSPMAFLALRFFIAFFILLIIASVLRVQWPNTLLEFVHISTAGLLTVGVFSIGVFLSISFGISASLSALIIALQPIVVTFLAVKLLGEKFNMKILIGLLLGILGVAFVVSSKVGGSSSQILGIVFSIIALLGLSFGNIYQKKYCSKMNLYSGGAIQTLSSTILVVPILLFFEDINITFNGDFLIALVYMSVGVSIGALSLLYVMIEKGEVSKVSSVFYMMPVCAALISYFLFDIDIDITMFIGIFAVLVGILLINKK